MAIIRMTPAITVIALVQEPINVHKRFLTYLLPALSDSKFPLPLYLAHEMCYFDVYIFHHTVKNLFCNGW